MSAWNRILFLLKHSHEFIVLYRCMPYQAEVCALILASLPSFPTYTTWFSPLFIYCMKKGWSIWNQLGTWRFAAKCKCYLFKDTNSIRDPVWRTDSLLQFIPIEYILDSMAEWLDSAGRKMPFSPSCIRVWAVHFTETLSYSKNIRGEERIIWKRVLHQCFRDRC